MSPKKDFHSRRTEEPKLNCIDNLFDEEAEETDKLLDTIMATHWKEEGTRPLSARQPFVPGKTKYGPPLGDDAKVPFFKDVIDAERRKIALLKAEKEARDKSPIPQRTQIIGKSVLDILDIPTPIDDQGFLSYP